MADWTNEIVVANMLDLLVNEMFTDEAAKAEAELRRMLWDNKVGFIRLAQSLQPRPLDDWHHEVGPVLWWKFPIDEPPYVGTPNDLGFRVEVSIAGELISRWIGAWPGYHTHWTPLATPAPTGKQT